jgi:hypothetical protein
LFSSLLLFLSCQQNPEGQAITHANKIRKGGASSPANTRHAEGVTALPKARLSALAVVCSLQSGLKTLPGSWKHNPPLDTTTPFQES